MEASKTIGSKVIVVTGCNKGIGFGIVKDLAAKPDNHTLILAVRSVDNGKKAVEEIEKIVPKFSERAIVHQLDISNSESVVAFAEWIKKEGKKIDCLINNAGIAYKGNAFGEEVVRVTFKTDFYGTVEITEKLLPHIVDSGKVIFVSTMMGNPEILKSEELKKQFYDPKITRDQIFKLAKDFYDSVIDNTYEKKGWARLGYSTSYLCLNTYIKVLAKKEDILKRGIQIYACSPGWIKTDMAGQNAPKTIEEAAICPNYLVYLPWKVDPSLQGQFFFKCKIVHPEKSKYHDVTPPGSPR